MAITPTASQASILMLNVALFDSAAGTTVMAAALPTYTDGNTYAQSLVTGNAAYSILDATQAYTKAITTMSAGTAITASDISALVDALVAYTGTGLLLPNVGAGLNLLATFLYNNSATLNNVWTTTAQQLVNKTTVAAYYTLDQGNTASSSTVLSTVTSDAATVTAGQNALTAQTFNLATAAEQKDGGAANDIFNGSDTTLILDVLNGNAGTDTLNYNDASGASKNINALGVTLNSVETINVRSTTGAVATTTAFTGVTDLNVLQGTSTTVVAGSTTNVAVSGVTGAIGIDGGQNITVTDATAGQTITIGGTTVNAGTITVTDSKVGAANIAVDGGTNVTLALTGAYDDAAGGAETIKVGNPGTATTMPSGVVSVVSTHSATAGTDVKMSAITVKGGSTITVTEASDTSKAAADTTGATLTQGAVTVVGGNGTTSVTVSQAASTAEVTARTAVAGVTESASVKFTALTAGQTVILGGLTFTATADMTKEEAAAAFANLSKGFVPTVGTTSGDTQSAGAAAKGLYTGYLTGWTSAAASGDTVVFTSTTATTAGLADLANSGTGTVTITTTQGVDKVTARTGVLGVANGAVTIDDAATAAITTVSVDGYAEGSTIGNTATLSKLANLTLANSGHSTAGTKTGDMTVDAAGVASLNLSVNNINGNVSLDGAADSALKTLNLTTTGADSSFALTAAAVKALNIDGSKKATLSSGTFTALETITVSGSASAVFDGDEADTLTSVNTSATSGAVTATINGTQATYTGGAGVDTVTLATGTALTKAIDLGAGDDTLSFAALNVTGSTATLSGGEGTDTLSMATATAAALDGSIQNFYTGFERLTINDAAASESIDLANLGFTSYVTTTGSNGTLTLNNLANNGTVVVTTAPTTGYTVGIKDAATGKADVLNVALNSTGNLAAGTLTAANVETININSTDTETGSTPTKNVNSLTLVATKATTVNVEGGNDLTLTNAGNTAVTLIDGSKMTGNLTVQAAGTVASTIKGGSGADTLTASGGNSGGTAQVSTITLTDGTNTGLDDNDTMSVVINGTKFTYTADNVVTMATAATGLASAIDADAAYTASYGAGVITVTAAVAGTPFTLSSYAVTDVTNDANAANLTPTIANNSTAGKAETQTIVLTADGAHNGDEVLTITFDKDGSAGVLIKAVDVALTAAATKGTIADDIVTALNADVDFNKVAVASKNGSDNVLITYGTDNFGTVSAAVKVGGTVTSLDAVGTAGVDGALAVSTLAVAGTLTGSKFNAGDQLKVTVDYDGIGAGVAETITYTVATAAGEALDTAMAGLATAINAKAGTTTLKSATYDAGTDTITVTDAISADTNGITLSAFTVVDGAETTNATAAAGAFATTTANVTPQGDTLIGNAGADTLKSGSAMTTMTGGDGQDLFLVNVASINVNAYSTITDFTASDLLQFNATTIGFKNAAVSLGNTAVFQDYANAAMNSLAAGEAGWFQFDTNTYVVLDAAGNSTSFVNGEDMIVKLTGLIDLTNANFNNTYDTIAL